MATTKPKPNSNVLSKPWWEYIIGGALGALGFVIVVKMIDAAFVGDKNIFDGDDD